MAKAGRGDDQYMLRFPPGLRDRVKAYAEKHGRSMNSEIIRILEREFPAPVSLEDRIFELVGMTEALGTGASDERLAELAQRLRDTLEDAFLRRLRDLSPEAQDAIAEARGRLQFAEMAKKQARFVAGLDDEERDLYMATGETTKNL